MLLLATRAVRPRRSAAVGEATLGEAFSFLSGL
jgi:hypothetical protein